MSVETGQAAPTRPPITAGKVARSLRAFSLPITVLPVLVSAAATAPPARWRWGVLLASVVGAALFHLAGNLFNDYFDFRGNVDRRTHDDDQRPGRLLVFGQLLPRDILTEAIICLLLAAAATAYLTWQCGPVILAFAAAAAAGGYAYTGPPFKLKYRALGEPAIFIIFGPLLVIGAAYAQVGHIVASAAWLSVPIGLATTAILTGNSFRDCEEDAQAGIWTLGRFAGGKVARGVYLLLVLCAAGGLMVMGFTGRGPLPLAAAPITLLLLGKPLKAALRGTRLPNIDALTARWETVLLAGVLLSYLLA
ncbi:MAG: prenyltransferase [Phycisphaerae bacterium]|jgi:1,4-dihydroxy-2-naphthoate octaprenyltransferase